MPFDNYADRFIEGGVGSGNYGHAGRKGIPGGSAPGTVNKAISNIREHGGTTISVHGDVATTGFAVAGLRDATGNKVERVYDRPITSRDVATYMRNNARQLAQSHTYLGAWVENGKTYLDISEVHANRSDALKEAHARDEIAIFDLGKFETIHTMSDQQRPSQSSGKQIKEADVFTRKMRMFFGKDQTPEQVAKTINAARNHDLGKKRT